MVDLAWARAQLGKRSDDETLVCALACTDIEGYDGWVVVAARGLDMRTSKPIVAINTDKEAPIVLDVQRAG